MIIEFAKYDNETIIKRLANFLKKKELKIKFRPKSRRVINGSTYDTEDSMKKVRDAEDGQKSNLIVINLKIFMSLLRI